MQVLSSHIKQLDILASQKYGIALTQLMENAGRSIFEEIKRDFTDNKFAVFCGKGNNGGDGFVAARLLKTHGCEVKVYMTHDQSELSETAKIAFDKLKSEKIHICKISEYVDEDAVVIDALLGISLSGAPVGNIKIAIDRINDMKNKVVSIDVPSGLSADDGQVYGSAVKADYTYTLALDKVGLNIHHGILLCGIKKVLDIGIPDAAVSELDLT